MPVIRKPFEVDELIRVVARYRPDAGAALAAQASDEPQAAACGA